MGVTEEQAREKWCPFAKFLYSTKRDSGTVVFAAANRFKERSDYSRCIASDCMAWRWRKTSKKAGQKYWQGYCGLAGSSPQ